LHLGATDYKTRPLKDRRCGLQQLNFGAPIMLSAPLPGTPQEIEGVIRAAGFEGVVAKRVDSTYQPGVRSPAWVKVEFSKRQEFVIGGYKSAGTFDSVLVGYYEGRKFFYAGKVRAGFTPRTRADLSMRIEPLRSP
jgi:bifunctional non-homologous end joining protein LigD